MQEAEHPDAFDRHEVRHAIRSSRADRRTIVPALDADNLHRLARALAELGVERERLHPVSLERVGATNRQRLLACLEVLEATTTESGFLLALGEVAGTLAGRLRRRWADPERLPFHPAVRGIH